MRPLNSLENLILLKNEQDPNWKPKPLKKTPKPACVRILLSFSVSLFLILLFPFVAVALSHRIAILQTTAPLDFSFNKDYEPGFKFYDKKLLDDVLAKDQNCHNFFRLLALCHTVMADQKGGELIDTDSRWPLTFLFSLSSCLIFLFIHR